MQHWPPPQLLQLAWGVAVPIDGATVTVSVLQLIVPQVVVAGMQMSTVPPAQTCELTSGAVTAQTLICTSASSVHEGT